MAFVKRILQKLRDKGRPSLSERSTYKSEDEYYSWFFTQNEYWNKPTANSDEQLRWTGIQKFVETIKTQKTNKLYILDLGCGRGWLTNLLYQYGEVIGIEPVAHVVRYANKLFPLLKITVGDSTTMLQNGFMGKFDIIVASEVLEHVSQGEKDKFAENIGLLLKIGGHVIISTPRMEAQKLYCTHANLSQPVEEWLSEDEVKSLFLNHSFKVVGFNRLAKKLGNSENLTEIYQLWNFKKN